MGVFGQATLFLFACFRLFLVLGLPSFQREVNRIHLLCGGGQNASLDWFRLDPVKTQKSRQSILSRFCYPNMVLMHECHRDHESRSVSLKDPPAGATPILVLVAIEAWLDSQQLAQVTMPIEEKVVVHLSGHQREHHRMLARERCFPLYRALDNRRDECGSHLLRCVVAKVLDTRVSHLLECLARPLRARIDTVVLLAFAYVGTDQHGITYFDSGHVRYMLDPGDNPWSRFLAFVARFHDASAGAVIDVHVDRDFPLIPAQVSETHLEDFLDAKLGLPGTGQLHQTVVALRGPARRHGTRFIVLHVTEECRLIAGLERACGACAHLRIQSRVSSVEGSVLQLQEEVLRNP